jgi:hypothetical protein
VNDSVSMHILEGRYNLEHKVPSLFNSQFFPLLHHLAESLVCTELQDDVDILAVLKHTVEFNDMFMMESFMDFDL